MQPIVAPNDQWTWVDVPGSKCASGTQTGFAVNPHAGATDLVFYMQGGGECTTATNCWGPKPAATFLTGFDSTTFAQFGVPKFPILDRSNADNPLKAASQIFVPYCTGDLHAGRKEVDMQVNGMTKPTWFWGANDIDLFLARLVPTFPNVTHIWIVGVSAGGFGTIIAYDQVASAWKVRVDGIDDSGPPLLGQNQTKNGSLAIWGYTPPTGCAAPCDSYQDILAYDRQSQPNSRFGFLLYAYDTTISSRYGYTNPADYTAAINAFSTSISSDSKMATFIDNQTGCDAQHPCHVLMNDDTAATGYLPWLTKMVNDDPTWADVQFTP
jgi:hypothetical protein